MYLADKPRSCLILAHHIKSVVIYIDAARHIAGATLYADMVLPVEDEFHGSNFGISDVPQPDIEVFLLEVKNEMWANINAFHQVYLYQMNRICRSRKFQSINGGCFRNKITQLVLTQYISTAYSKDRSRCDNERDTPPHRWRSLWKIKIPGTANDLIAPMQLQSTCRDLQASAPNIAKAVMAILKSKRISQLLKSLLGKKGLCTKCVEASTPDAIYVLQDDGDWLGPPPEICHVHGHKAHHSGRLAYTDIHGWGTMTRSYEGRSEVFWPPPAYEYEPNRRRVTLPYVETGLVGRETLEDLGLSKVFLKEVDEVAYQRHIARQGP